MGNAELDEVAPTFRELLEGSGVSFVQACVDGVDLAGKKVSVVGALSDDLEGFMVSDNADESEGAGASYRSLFHLHLYVYVPGSSHTYQGVYILLIVPGHAFYFHA